MSSTAKKIAEKIDFTLRFDEPVFVDQFNSIFSKAISELAPRERLTVSEWAEKYRWIGAEGSFSSQNMKWHNDVVPYSTMIMDQYNNPYCRMIIFRAAAQVSKTEILLNIIGYSIHLDPCPILFIMPDKKKAVDDFIVPRFKPMIKATKVLAERFPKSRNFKNTETLKQFKGGYIRVTGTDPNELRSRVQKLILIDEFSAISMHDKVQGSTLTNARKRQTTIYDNKTVLASTPLQEGSCAISRHYEESKRHVRENFCPHCNEPFLWDIRQLVYDSKNFKKAYYECEACDGKISQEMKPEVVRNARWLCLDPNKSEENMGFHLSSFDSPFVSFAEIAQKYEYAKKNPEEEMQNFYNNELGLPYSVVGENPDKKTIIDRCEPYGEEIPRDVLALSCGVDVNSKDITYSIWGWRGHEMGDEEGWLIRYEIIPGDPFQSEVWLRLEEKLFRRFSHQNGYKMALDAIAVDTKFSNDKAEEFCLKNAGRGVYAVQGVPERHKKIIDQPFVGQKSNRKKRRIPTYPVGDFQAKWAIYSRLKTIDEGPGFLHFPKEDSHQRGCDEKYFRELTRERIITEYSKGRTLFSFERPKGKRNEALDTLKYAFAIMKAMRFDFLAREIKAKEQSELALKYKELGRDLDEAYDKKKKALKEILIKELRANHSQRTTEYRARFKL